MKKIILFIFSAILIFTACKQKQTGSDVQWSPDRKDSVVYVNYQRQDGSFSNFYMNYMLYSMLFRQGGYGSVYNYYESHPSEFYNQRSRYSGYRSNSYFTNRNGSSSYSSGTRSYSSPSRSVSSPTRSSSSPSRSFFGSSGSSSRSFSSPSRGFSSPSRSFSSPSRSFSSPSRR